MWPPARRVWVRPLPSCRRRRVIRVYTPIGMIWIWMATVLLRRMICGGSVDLKRIRSCISRGMTMTSMMMG